MKKQKKILWKKGIRFAFSEKWNTRFASFKKFYFPQNLCFLKTKLGRPVVWGGQLKHLHCGKKALHTQTSWIRDVPLCANAESGVSTQSVSTLYGKVKSKATRYFISSSGSLLKLQADKVLSSAENLDHEYCREKSLLKAVTGLSANTVLGKTSAHKSRTGPQASDFPMKFNGERQSPGESGKIVVLNKHRKRDCYGYYQGLEHHRNGKPLIPKKFQLNQHRRVKVSLMMYEKLSMIRFRYRVFRSQHFRTKNRVCKLRRAHRSWVQKVTGDHQESLRANTEGGNCNPVPSPEPKDPCRYKANFSDMDGSVVVKGKNSPVPDGYTRESPFLDKEHSLDEALPDQQNGSATYAWDQSPSSPKWECTEQIHEIPFTEHPSSTTFTSETERAVMTLGQESGTGAVSEDKVKLPASGPDTSVSSLDRPAASEEPLKTENFQMEEDGSLKQNILSSKLLDHPYCKSPLDAPLVCDELKIENQVAGGRSSQKAASPVDDEQLSTCLSGFLDEVMKKYGSLVPLSEKDVLGRLKDVFNEDFSNRKPFINREITNYRARHQKCNFRIFYNKHMLDMDDLATLDGQNWLNDQVINMYGELIMDAVPDKVHFFNSFFHRQLVTKGYNGVKRWTKKVDLFKKSLLLIPIHLEVHWSLITVTLSNRIISFYDSQGIHFKFCVENIRKYLLTEAREKNRPEFLQGWQTAVTKCIPQQKNDSDCGVFVLQYCKCLALEQPFQFSQEDMPRVRKRIYKELCECRLLD
ncbi:sentrin-specific protease 5 isoform X1 [Sigmodon hispidus]